MLFDIARRTTGAVAFHYPFEGVMTPIPRAGLFSYSLDIHLKLLGHSPRSVFADNGMDGLWRRMVRMEDTPIEKRRGGARLLKDMNDMLETMGAPMAVMARMREAYESIRTGEPLAFVPIHAEALMLGSSLSPDEWPLSGAYMVALEHAGRVAEQHLYENRMEEGAHAIAAHPLLSRLVWPGILEKIRSCEAYKDISWVTSSMALDANLGYLAAWDVQLTGADSSESAFTCLLPSGARPGRNPTSLLFDELRGRLGLASAPDMLRGNTQPPVELGTLHRWSAGTHFPDPSTFRALLAFHGLDDAADKLSAQLSVSKFIHMLGWIAETICAVARFTNNDAAWPYPQYPFEHENFEDWAADRYPAWLAYFRTEHAAVTEMAKAASVLTGG
jgi:hypothetical protein